MCAPVNQWATIKAAALPRKRVIDWLLSASAPRGHSKWRQVYRLRCFLWTWQKSITHSHFTACTLQEAAFAGPTFLIRAFWPSQNNCGCCLRSDNWPSDLVPRSLIPCAARHQLLQLAHTGEENMIEYWEVFWVWKVALIQFLRVKRAFDVTMEWFVELYEAWNWLPQAGNLSRVCTRHVPFSKGFV